MNISTTNDVRQLLFSKIESLLDSKDKFLINPKASFTRVKKISFLQTVLFPMIAESKNLATEMLDFFPEEKIPGPSAMIQRRHKIRPEAFIHLFNEFTNAIPRNKDYHSYQIVACDGSRLNLPYNPSDPETFIQCIEGRKGINQMHMNALYDTLNGLFLDIELQGIHHLDEKAAFAHFLDKYAGSEQSKKMIFLADRGYCSYNLFAHGIHNNELFLIRVPGYFAEKMCTDSNHWLKGPFVDEEITVHIGRRDTKKHRMLENYHCISKKSRYDYIELGSDDVDCLHFRVLKFPLSDNSFEYIVTNIPRSTFSFEKIKELYHLRWNEETAFRYLKYACNMVRIHSLTKDFILQEIYAKLTFYNFSSFVEAVAIDTKKRTEKHEYAVNRTQCMKLCIRFLRGALEEIDDKIKRFMVPVRKDRIFQRNIRRQSADTLNYR